MREKGGRHKTSRVLLPPPPSPSLWLLFLVSQHPLPSRFSPPPLHPLSQWPGSQRRVWSWDPVDLRFWAKMYDECGTQVSKGGQGLGGSTTTDCDENEAIVSMQPFAPGEDFWYVFVEPIEPELTQMVWVWTNVVN